MATVKKRTFSLPKQQAAYIDRLVKSGAYASASEVVRDGLRSLQEHDAMLEKWLRTEVVDAYDDLEKNPGNTIPAKEVFEALRKHHANRSKKKSV